MKCLASRKAPRSVTNAHLTIRMRGDKCNRFDGIQLQTKRSALEASGVLTKTKAQSVISTPLRSISVVARFVF
jgi:hypothetical protein